MPTPGTDLEKVIKAAVDRGASDLHIKAGDVFRARINGRLVPLTKQRLTPEQTKAIALRLIPSEAERGRIDRLRDYDCSWGMPGIGRFRVNILRQRSSFMIVMRVIPFDVPTFDTLQLPAVLQHVAAAERGLILVTGAAGSGKTSVMAAIVNHINHTQHKHILTLENPIEFLHRDVNCSVTQREIGTDTDDFRNGLRAALRQDPDVILVGEMRDAETLDTALKAAETGHLVVSTLYTGDALSTVNRAISIFPAEEQGVTRVRLAEALQAIVSLRLLPRADGEGRVVAVEVLLCTAAARDLIRDAGRIAALPAYMRESREQHGMQTFDQHLADLVGEGTVTHETAAAASADPGELEQQLRSREEAEAPAERAAGIASSADGAAPQADADSDSGDA